MTKEQTAAIIEAIQTTATFFMENGLTLRDRFVDPDEDNTQVQALLTEYATAIETIINSIPDD